MNEDKLCNRDTQLTARRARNAFSRAGRLGGAGPYPPNGGQQFFSPPFAHKSLITHDSWK
jgi:hypothetical protein